MTCIFDNETCTAFRLPAFQTRACLNHLREYVAAIAEDEGSYTDLEGDAE